jgi:hypothetical protein
MRILTLFILACGGDSSDKSNPEDTGSAMVAPNWDCDPIAPTVCGLPFPSTYFMTESEASVTGWQVSMGETTIPANVDGDHTSPRFLNEKDGFSPLTPAITHMDGAVADGLISHTDLEAFTAADAKTVIIDLQTGERVAHFAEVDASAEWDSSRILMLHPVTPLAHGGRYLVGIRGVVDGTGETIEASEGFAVLRDDTATADPRIEARRDHYNETLFPALAAEGFDRADMQLAWDFVVASKENITGKSM